MSRSALEKQLDYLRRECGAVFACLACKYERDWNGRIAPRPHADWCRFSFETFRHHGVPTGFTPESEVVLLGHVERPFRLREIASLLGKETRARVAIRLPEMLPAREPA